MALALKYLICPFCSMFMTCVFTMPSFNTFPAPLEIPFVQLSIWQGPAHCSAQFNHYLLCGAFLNSLMQIYGHCTCVWETPPAYFCFSSHCNAAWRLFTCQGSSMSEPLSLIDLEFPTQAMLHKPCVSNIPVSCCWLRNEAVVLLYHDILTEENETFKE